MLGQPFCDHLHQQFYSLGQKLGVPNIILNGLFCHYSSNGKPWIMLQRLICYGWGAEYIVQSPIYRRLYNRILFSVQPSGSCCKYWKVNQKDVMNTQSNCWYAAKGYFKVFWCGKNERMRIHPASRNVKGLKIKLQIPIMSNIIGEFFRFFSQHSFSEVLTSKLILERRVQEWFPWDVSRVII